jgi:hypothetical protein
LNSKHARVALIAAAFACASPSGGSLAATTYTYVDLGAGPNGKTAYGYGGSPKAQGGAYLDHSISCGRGCTANIYYPLAWSGPGSSPLVLLPQFYVEGWAYGAGGSLIVGTLITNNAGYFGYPHAALWQGPSHHFTDLNTSGTCGSCSPGSNAYATDGTFIAGSGGSPNHALVWKLGQLSTPVDLNPAGSAYSEAFAVSGPNVAGYAYSNTTSTIHAVLWNGAAASVVDLTPPAMSSAYATGLGYKSEVGCGTPVGLTASHALLWHGTAASTVDLQPAGFADSCARAAHGNLQVGYGHISGTSTVHALLWKGSAKSVVDLQQYLPSTFTNSQAYGIDATGDIFGSAYTTATGTWHAVIWVP